MLGQPTPAGHDATGAEYTFEKGVAVTGIASAGSRGNRGFADVWWRGKFGWEYKRRDKYRDLSEAYRQLCEALDDLLPPVHRQPSTILDIGLSATAQPQTRLDRPHRSDLNSCYVRSDIA
jgi:hypothetical protein